MNDMEKFLNFGAVVKVRRFSDDELYNFIKLMKSMGFLSEYIDSFEKNCCYDKEFQEFSNSAFWDLVEMNRKNSLSTCIEFQWEKGFTFGDEKDYTDYDIDIKILSVDDLIKSCNKEELFKMNYIYTSFRNELKDKKIALELDNFLIFYEWGFVKYPDGKYNIRDEQCNTFDFEENTNLEEITKRVYFRMLDYFMDEQDIEEMLEGDEDDIRYVHRTFEIYMEIGKKLNLLNDKNYENYINSFNEIIEKSKTNEFNKEI